MKFEFSIDGWGNQVVMLHGASAKVVCDSITPDGRRLTSGQERFWRPVLAERNTPRIQAKNSASSRAIPFDEMLRRFEDDPADPIVWPAEQKGMQGETMLEGEDLDDAQDLWRGVKSDIAGRMHRYVGMLESKYGEDAKKHRLHKGHLNRILEFGQWHVDTVTATGWENWFEQRCTPLAMPEIAAVAECMREAMRISEPNELPDGAWHLPYIRKEDHTEASRLHADEPSAWRWLAIISAARVARTSYLTMDGKRDWDKDVALYHDVLLSGPHWSPLEQVATPWPQNVQDDYTKGLNFIGSDGVNRHVETNHLPKTGPFPGWRTLRTEVETEMGIITYR